LKFEFFNSSLHFLIPAERQLSEAQQISGHPLTALRIVAGDLPSNPAVRQAAAVHFKNIVKNGWDEHNEVRKLEQVLCVISVEVSVSPFHVSIGRTAGYYHFD
jgi:hypothetical protein